MQHNITGTERILRLALGICCLAASYIWWAATWLGLPVGWIALGTGLTLIATGTLGFCLMYKALGVKPRHV